MSPEMTKLTEEFNRTAEAFVRCEASVGLLLAKHAILMKYKSETPEERAALTQTLYTKGVSWLLLIAEPGAELNGYMVQAATDLLTRLVEPESIAFLSPGAPQHLTDVGLHLLRGAEKRKTGDSFNRNVLVGMAEQTILFADKVRAYQEAQPVQTPGPEVPAPATPAKKNDERLSL